MRASAAAPNGGWSPPSPRAPARRCVVSASWDRSIVVHDDMDNERGILLRDVSDTHTADIACMALSDHLSLIATGAVDGSVHVWDFEVRAASGIHIRRPPSQGRNYFHVHPVPRPSFSAWRVPASPTRPPCPTCASSTPTRCSSPVTRVETCASGECAPLQTGTGAPSARPCRAHAAIRAADAACARPWPPQLPHALGQLHGAATHRALCCPEQRCGLGLGTRGGGRRSAHPSPGDGGRVAARRGLCDAARRPCECCRGRSKRGWTRATVVPMLTRRPPPPWLPPDAVP